MGESAGRQGKGTGSYEGKSIRWRGKTDAKGRPVKDAGSYTAYWWVIDGQGRRVQKSKGGFWPKSEAEKFLNVTRAEVDAGTWSQPKRFSLEHFLVDEWLPTVEKRPTTKASYKTTVEKWIVPHIGGVRLSALTAGDIQSMLAALRANGRRNGKALGDRSVQYAYTVLRMALDHAVARGFMPRNPAAAVNRPSSSSAEMQAWTADEAAAFLDFVADDRMYAAWLLFLQRGFRRGEIAGLRWSDVDLKLGRISVRHTRVMVGAKAEASEPKTSAGRRNVPISASLVAALKAHSKRQKAERLAIGAVWQDTGYVFVREDGMAPAPEYFSTRFESLVSKARDAEQNEKKKVRPIRLHDTRHTCATLALEAGEKTEVVSKWLGHASVAITQEIYQHVIPAMLEEAGERLDAIVDSRRAVR